MKYCFALFLMAISCLASAQTAEDSVKAVVNQMFTAMLTADANLLTESFGDSAILQTIVEKVKKQVLKPKP